MKHLTSLGHDMMRGWQRGWMGNGLALWMGLLLPSAAIGQGVGQAVDLPANVPIVTAVQAETKGEATRLVFDISRAVVPTVAALTTPDRLVVDLPQVNFQIDADSGHLPNPVGQGKGGQVGAKSGAKSGALSGLVQSFRFGLFAPGKSRIVIDLASPARVVKAVCEPGPTGRMQLVIALEHTDRAHFNAAAEVAAQTLRTQPGSAQGALPAADKSASNGRPLVVLDAGHGGVDTGALGAPGVVEKDITFAFAAALKAKLEASGQVRVLLTRPTDIFVPLGERVQIARKAGADLFLSIHADIVPDSSSVSGATVYTVSDKASDTDAARVAAAENLADVAGGLDTTEDRDDVTDILVDLTRRETRAYSHVFAKSIVSYWRGVGRLNKNPERSAGFVVLKAPDVPSVLLELGYLSNAQDTKSLTSPEWRAQAVASVEKSIGLFFAPRGSPAPASGAQASSDKASSSVAPTDKAASTQVSGAGDGAGGAQLRP